MTTTKNLIAESAKEHEEMIDRMIEEVKCTLAFAKHCKDNKILGLELKFRGRADSQIKLLNIATKTHYFIGNDYELVDVAKVGRKPE